MSSSFEKAVKGGTKVKCAPPKAKYVSTILLATESGDAGVAEVFRTLTPRLRDSTWTVAFKSLIIVHLMIKEGAENVTLRYLAVSPQNRLAINSFTDVQTQGQNIRMYSDYLLARARGFEKYKCDHARAGEGRMKRLTVDKGLLRETEGVQDQIRALTRCDLLSNDVENEISLTAFRLLTRDLLDLYNVENEAVMNVLSHYFEMSKPDAERAIKIYKRFCSQTEQVVQYLSMARNFAHATRLEIPRLKHAPTSLARSLQEYLDDPDFEVNRRQYLAEQEARKVGKPTFKAAQTKSAPSSSKTSTPVDAPPAAPQIPSAPRTAAPDLIDFFESIDNSQEAAATNPFLQQQQQAPQPQPQPQQQQFMGFQAPPQHIGFQPPVQQQPPGYGSNGVPTDAFGQLQINQPPAPQPIQTQYTGAGFGGYGPQPVQSQQIPSFASNTFSPVSQPYLSPVQQEPPQQLQPQPTNPFRHSAIPTSNVSTFSAQTFEQQPAQAPTRQGTNPFARSQLPPSIPEGDIFQSQASPFANSSPFQAQPLQAQPTGTNPFARTAAQPTQQPTAPALSMQATGSTNPFRQSMFVNQQTGQGWQQTQQPTIGGIEQLPTVPVFPRPGQAPTGQQQQQQQQQQSPWM